MTAPGFCCFLRAARLLLLDDLEVVIVCSVTHKVWFTRPASENLRIWRESSTCKKLVTKAQLLPHASHHPQIVAVCQRCATGIYNLAYHGWPTPNNVTVQYLYQYLYERFISACVRVKRGHAAGMHLYQPA